MQTAPDREDLPRPTDNASTNTPDVTADSKLHDLSALWCDLGGS